MTGVAETGRALTRRAVLAAGGAGGAMLAAAPAIAVAGPDRASLEKAFEALRIAMVDGDGAALCVMLGDGLIYMHSSGHAQTKRDLLHDLAGRRFFASLTNLEMVFAVSDRTGIVTATVDQVKNLPGDKTRASRIKIMQTWAWRGRWVLLARLSSIISSPLSPACRAGQAAERAAGATAAQTVLSH